MNSFKIIKHVFTPDDLFISNAIICELGRAVAEIIPFKRKWGFRIEDIKGNEESPHYVVAVHSDDWEEGCECVDKKIYTLCNRPNLSSTRDMVDYQMSEGEVCWYGGLSLPYIGHEGPNMTPVKGFVRIAFSGALEVEDLIIALRVLLAYIKACDDFIPDSSYVYDMERLMDDPLIRYLMKGIF